MEQQEMNLRIAFEDGKLLADNMLRGYIVPDFSFTNIGIAEHGRVLIDSASAFRKQIPDDLDELLVNQLSESLFSYLRSVDDNSVIGAFRAGFISYGGILADIVWNNLANKGFSSLSFMRISDVSLKYDVCEKICFDITEKLIREWADTELTKINKKNFQILDLYVHSKVRKDISSFSLPYLYRLYYIMNYELNPEGSPEVDFDTMRNMGISAFRNNEKYLSFGMLNRFIRMSDHSFEDEKYCLKTLNELKHKKRLSSELKELILNNIELGFFDFLWLLNDIDTFEEQLLQK